MRLRLAGASQEILIEALTRAVSPGRMLKGSVSREKVVLSRNDMSRLPVEFAGTISLVEGQWQLDGEIRVPVLWRMATVVGVALMAVVIGRMAARAMHSVIGGILLGACAWGTIVSLQMLSIKYRQRKLAAEIAAVLGRAR